MDEDVWQYADDVTDFSSQYGSEISISYTVSNITGPSTIYPNYGDYTQAAVLVCITNEQQQNNNVAY